MKRSKAYVIGGIFLSFAFLLANASPANAQTDSLISFSLEDQFETVHTQNSWSHRIIVLLGTDREGAQFSPAWGKAIRDSLGDESGVAIIPLSDLSNVPFFLKGFVRGKFPKERDRWVLLDWDGTFSESYGFSESCSNLLIFDLNRKLVYQKAVRELQQDEVNRVVDLLRRLAGA